MWLCFSVGIWIHIFFTECFLQNPSFLKTNILKISIWQWPAFHMVLHYSWKDDFWEKSGYNKGNSLKHRTIKLIIQNRVKVEERFSNLQWLPASVILKKWSHSICLNKKFRAFIQIIISLLTFFMHVWLDLKF